MKKFRKVLDGLTTSSPVNTGGSPACGSAAGTPTAAPTPRELDIQETLMSEHFQICKLKNIFLLVAYTSVFKTLRIVFLGSEAAVCHLSEDRTDVNEASPGPFPASVGLGEYDISGGYPPTPEEPALGLRLVRSLEELFLAQSPPPPPHPLRLDGPFEADCGDPDTDRLKLFLCSSLQTVRHGFPYQPTALTFDPVQKILAIGSRSGGVRMYPLLGAPQGRGFSSASRPLGSCSSAVGGRSSVGAFHLSVHVIPPIWSLTRQFMGTHRDAGVKPLELPPMTAKDPTPPATTCKQIQLHQTESDYGGSTSRRKCTALHLHLCGVKKKTHGPIEQSERERERDEDGRKENEREIRRGVEGLGGAVGEWGWWTPLVQLLSACLRLCSSTSHRTVSWAPSTPAHSGDRLAVRVRVPCIKGNSSVDYRAEICLIRFWDGREWIASVNMRVGQLFFNFSFSSMRFTVALVLPGNRSSFSSPYSLANHRLADQGSGSSLVFSRVSVSLILLPFCLQGALVTACADDTLHLWNLRQRRPAILHSLKFNRERITFCHLPFQSKWLYVGTERGNTHIVNVESFILSGYVIMWNKAIELSTKTHPGPIVHLSDSPKDEGKLLIGFESGTIVMWDLRSKRADFRIYYDEAIHSVSWHHEGRQFMCSHSDGSLSMWNLRNTAKPFQVTFPHGKSQRDGRKESCKPILKVEYKTCRNSESFVIFSGGLSYDKAGWRPTLTIMHGKAITVLEMDHPIVEFLVLCETPYLNEVQEPYAAVVLLEKDLIVVDLTQSSFPIFENPYPMDIHESPVTCTAYFADCPPDIIPVLYSIGAKHKKTGYSHKEWPVSGGTWTVGSQSYPEIIITGHADGSIKFWDATAITLQMLYKLKTSKVFEKPKGSETARGAELVEEDPYAVQMVSWCPQSRIFCVVGISAHVILYCFSRHDANTAITSLEVRLQCEVEDVISPSDTENAVCLMDAGGHSPQPPSPRGNTPDAARDSIPCLKVKDRVIRMPPGYQAELVVQLLWVDGEPPQQITSLDLNSAYGLLALGNCNGLVVVDYLQKTIILCMTTLELYGSADPFQRLTRSPRKNRQSTSEFCMRGLSNFYSDSKKRIRTSYQTVSDAVSLFWTKVFIFGVLYPFFPPPLPSDRLRQGLTELSDNQVSLDQERSKSPTSVACSSSAHTDPRGTAEPVCNLRASHYSPVFYLLDNGKSRIALSSLVTPVFFRSVKGPGRKLSLPTDLKSDLGTFPNLGSTRANAMPVVADHVNGHCTSPTSQACPPGRPRVPGGPEGPRLARRGPGRPPFRKAQSAACMEVSLPVSFLTEESRENSFSRSRSSSVSSIDRDTKEAVTTLHFAESYGRRSDVLPAPCLWVGTSLGLVLIVPMSIPTDEQERMEEPVTIAPTSTVLMLKGSILRFSFLDCTGGLIHSPHEAWRDTHAPDDPERPRRRRLVNFSPCFSQEAGGDGHLAVVCSERQAKVFFMPSQACLYVHNITESSFVLRADVVAISNISNSVCLACFCANGHIMILSLPSLRPLLDVHYLPLTDMRIARTFCFTNGGQALYLSSPTEIQRITYSQEMCDNLQEMLGELFTPTDTPEAQNRGFLKGFFGGNTQTFDREELFGEAAAGKASRSLAQHIPGQGSVEGVRAAAGGAVGELARARIALDERGQRLGELEERTALMMASAETFSKHAHEVRGKCSNRQPYREQTTR
ncbi:hypothetical protein P4O66_008092 [Electrophorus voltai]|uniref:Syntaxin-binding protein 5-like n=1 Tax=Electrophorus voltai TaxID=2609070 RepID=A0AAD8ZGT5_9TELE|nr:hypothetical protein P4O66_008092 [Electrophorus voltai]